MNGQSRQTEKEKNEDTAWETEGLNVFRILTADIEEASLGKKRFRNRLMNCALDNAHIMHKA